MRNLQMIDIIDLRVWPLLLLAIIDILMTKTLLFAVAIQSVRSSGHVSFALIFIANTYSRQLDPNCFRTGASSG